MLKSRSVLLQILLPATGVIMSVPSTAWAALPSLGQAGQYAVYGSSTEILINSAGTTVTGDVALGPSGTLNFLGGTITGGFHHDSASTLNIAGGAQILGGMSLIDPTPIQNDAHAAAAEANALLSTQSFNSLGNGAMIHGEGGLNVINVTTNILLTNGGTLTLVGDGSEEFLINVNGTMTLTGASSIQLINVLPEQILWNFVGEGTEVLFENSSGIGNILAVDRAIRFEGGSNLGSLISNGDRIKLQDGAQITAIPEPTTGLLALFAISALLGRRKTLANKC